MTATASPNQFDLNSLLSARSGKSLDPTQFSYKLAGEDSVGHYGLDAIVVAEPEVDEAKMCFWLPYADGNRRDGVGDLLEVGGIDHSRHVANPISLFDHGKQVVLPIGMVADPDTGEYKTEVDVVNKTARDYVHMYQGKGMKGVERDKEYDHAVFCSQLFDLWVRKFVRGGSIGYQVMKAVQLAPDYENGTPQGLHLIRTKKLESSVVVMPANQSTVHKSMGWDGAREVLCMNGVCGKPLSPYLIKSFSAYAPPAKAQLGWEPRPGNVSGKDLAHSCGCGCGGSCGCGTKQAPLIGGPSEEDDYRHPYGKALENGPSTEALKAADFVHFPKGIDGTNCGNCQYQKNAVCQYHGPSRRDGKVIDLRGLKVTPKDCCGEWDAHGVTRPWEGKGEKSVDLKAEMDAHKEEKVPLENIHTKDGVLTAKEDSSIGSPRDYDNPLSNTHIPPPPQRQKWTMGKARAKYHAKRLGTKILRHEGGKWVLYSHSGRVLGRHDSKEEGLAQERAIEAHKGYSPILRFEAGGGKPIPKEEGPDKTPMTPLPASAPSSPKPPHAINPTGRTAQGRPTAQVRLHSMKSAEEHQGEWGIEHSRYGRARRVGDENPTTYKTRQEAEEGVGRMTRLARQSGDRSSRFRAVPHTSGEKSLPARMRYRAMRTGEKVIAGDLNWLKEEEQEAEHKTNGVRAKYHRKGLVDQLPDPTGRERESISHETLANSPGGSEECREDKNTGAKAMPEGNRSPKTDRVVANTSGGNAITDRKISQVPFVQQQQDSMMKQRMTRNKYRRKGLTDQLPDKTGRERASIENESLANSSMGSEKPTKPLDAKGKGVGLPPNFNEVVKEKGEDPYKGPWGVTTEKLQSGHVRHWASNGIHTQTARGPYKERHEAQAEADRQNTAYLERRSKKHLTGFEDQTDTEDTVGRTLSARSKGLVDISNVRAKYRTDRKPVSADKPTRRRLRNSKGGRTLLYIEVPHLRKCGEMAGRLGLKFSHVGFRSGHAKIYLDGDNGLCDAVAHEFGCDIKKPVLD